MFGRVRSRKAAEAALAAIEEQLTIAQNNLHVANHVIKQRAVLVSIETEGKAIKFTFVRNGAITIIETYLTLSADIPTWKRELLEPLP